MPPEAVAAELRLLSLALLDAVQREDVEEASALFSRREVVLDDCHRERVTLSPTEISELSKLNEDILACLRDGKSRLVDARRAQVAVINATRAYARP